MPKPAPPWQFTVAYALLALPGLYVAVEGGAYPVPPDFAARFYVLIGFAVGAGVFVVRRRRRDVLGWAGLLFWLAVCALGVGGALLG